MTAATRRPALLALLGLGWMPGLSAQTGRTVELAAPALLGTSLSVRINHPVNAGGNYFEALASLPTTATLNLGLPIVRGLLRVDLTGFFTLSNGALATATATTWSLPLPTSQALLGARFDVQSVDVDLGVPELLLADNDVTPRIASLCDIGLARSPTTNVLNAANDVLRLRDSSVGAPTSQGLPTFAYGVIRHRGEHGYVEGYGGTFSATGHHGDIDSQSYRRISRRLANALYQVVSLPSGHDISIVRDNTNPHQFSVLSYERSTATARLVPGTTVTDTNTGPPQTAVQALGFYPGFSRNGQWAACIVTDSGNSPPPDRVLAFRTDGLTPAIDITPTSSPSDRYDDGSLFFTNDFLIVTGTAGMYWTSASSPSTLQPLTLPNVTASGAPNRWSYPFSWRISSDGAVAYFPIGSHATDPRLEMDVVRLSNNGGTPACSNWSRFAQATGVCEFGYMAITPSARIDSLSGIKCAVSPDGQKLAVLLATGGGFLGLAVCDGNANPSIHTVAGANHYAEVAFLNDTTVLFFAGPNYTTHSFHRLDVPTGTVTQLGTATDFQTRGQFWSLNKNWWYFVRGSATAPTHDIVGVDARTGAVKDITGNEWNGGSLPSLRTGGIDTTIDPWIAYEFQLRRAPTGNRAYFMARRETAVANTFEDANLFAFDIETGGVASMLTNHTGRGSGTASLLNLEGLTISADGHHLAWAQRRGDLPTSSEDVFHLDLTNNTLRQVSISRPTGQSITDGSIRFTCGPAPGLVWAVGTDTTSTSVPTANTQICWAALGGDPAFALTPLPTGVQVLQVIGTR